MMGGGRSNWFSDHPSECTCAACESRKADQRDFQATHGGRRIGRNERCPCGSGRKYKRCHGSA